MVLTQELSRAEGPCDKLYPSFIFTGTHGRILVVLLPALSTCLLCPRSGRAKHLPCREAGQSLNLGAQSEPDREVAGTCPGEGSD